MRLPEGWREQAPGKWFDAAGDARGVILQNGSMSWAMVEGCDRSTATKAESDLERMVWALEGEDVAMVRADRDKALTRADLSDKALAHARQEIADLRAEINRMEARERRRHPLIRKIAHALYVLRGAK